MCLGGPSLSVLEAGWGLSWQAAMHRWRERCQFPPAFVPCLLQSCWRKVSWNISQAQYLNCGPPAHSHLFFGVSVHPSSSLTVSLLTPGCCFSKILYMRYLPFWGKILLMLTASKLHDIKFWLILCSSCGCQVWVITSAFRKHRLCLCTWRVVSETCSNPSALQSGVPTAVSGCPWGAWPLGSMRLELLSCLKLWVHIHPCSGFWNSKHHSFGSTQNWTSGESPRDFEIHWLI